MVRLFKFILYIPARFAAKVLDILIPVHAKRILFLATLYKAMRKGKEIDHKVLKELNDTLHLAKTSPDALVIPLLLSRWIWSEEMAVLLTCSREQVRVKIRTAPQWLRYGREEDIMHDVMMLRAFSSSA